MNDLTSTNIIKQSEMQMSDGSVLTYNIDITLQTRHEDTIAYQQLQQFCGTTITPIEQILVHLLCDPSEEEEEDDSIDEDAQGDDDDQGEDQQEPVIGENENAT
jgi:hypothetical protein